MNNTWFGFFLGVMFASGIIGMSFLFYNKECPSAIDVYRGNTTLEITYRDSIPVDSIVVWK